MRRTPPAASGQARAAHRRLSAWLAGALVVSALGFSSATCAAAGDDDGDEDKKTWQEIEVRLPPFPQADKLIPFEVSATTNNRFLIDGDSLNVGSDGVLRYTLVIVSPSGVQNISFEGMRCATGERRVYAMGRADGTWSKARSDRWQTIAENTLNRHHAALFSDYFCAIGVSLRDADDARRALRYGGQPAALRR